MYAQRPARRPLVSRFLDKDMQLAGRFFLFFPSKKVAASLKFPAAFFPLPWVSVGFVAIRGVSVEGFDPKMTGGIIVVSLN